MFRQRVRSQRAVWRGDKFNARSARGARSGGSVARVVQIDLLQRTDARYQVRRCRSKRHKPAIVGNGGIGTQTVRIRRARVRRRNQTGGLHTACCTEAFRLLKNLLLAAWIGRARPKVFGGRCKGDERTIVGNGRLPTRAIPGGHSIRRGNEIRRRRAGGCCRAAACGRIAQGVHVDLRRNAVNQGIGGNEIRGE